MPTNIYLLEKLIILIGYLLLTKWAASLKGENKMSLSYLKAAEKILKDLEIAGADHDIIYLSSEYFPNRKYKNEDGEFIKWFDKECDDPKYELSLKDTEDALYYISWDSEKESWYIFA
jgi:hypothetical protein